MLIGALGPSHQPVSLSLSLSPQALRDRLPAHPRRGLEGSGDAALPSPRCSSQSSAGRGWGGMEAGVRGGLGRESGDWTRGRAAGSATPAWRRGARPEPRVTAPGVRGDAVQVRARRALQGLSVLGSGRQLCRQLRELGLGFLVPLQH